MNRRTRLITCITAVAALAAAGIGAVAVSPDASAVVKRPYDIAWPQCPGPGSKPMPDPAATSLVVIQVTDGRAFTKSRCLTFQHNWATSNSIPAHAYAWVNYPNASQLSQYGGSGPWSGSTDAAKLRNVGYAQAKSAATSLASVSW